MTRKDETLGKAAYIITNHYNMPSPLANCVRNCLIEIEWNINIDFDVNQMLYQVWL